MYSIWFGYAELEVLWLVYTSKISHLLHKQVFHPSLNSSLPAQQRHAPIAWVLQQPRLPCKVDTCWYVAPEVASEAGERAVFRHLPTSAHFMCCQKSWSPARWLQSQCQRSKGMSRHCYAAAWCFPPGAVKICTADVSWDLLGGVVHKHSVPLKRLFPPFSLEKRKITDPKFNLSVKSLTPISELFISDFSIVFWAALTGDSSGIAKCLATMVTQCTHWEVFWY